MSEKKKEESRRRAKSVRDNAMWARKTGTSRQMTPGVKVVGAPLFRDDPKDTKKESEVSLESMVLAYILRKNGIEITEQTTTPTIYRKVEDAEVADVMIARILGPDEKFGLDRKFFFKSRQSFHAHRFPDGTVIEVGLQSYSGYVSRTYYVVDGTEFRPFAQDNFRKTD
ncbi:hypothetical protein EU528_11050 [Candidatus Thorarchaeota archaeon]|nr:MAG: hypothetical protein EU528_11050 [Candidatus Thorarchaeota archaeon]